MAVWQSLRSDGHHNSHAGDWHVVRQSLALSPQSHWHGAGHSAGTRTKFGQKAWSGPGPKTGAGIKVVESAARASRCRDTRHEKKGANITRPRYQETTNRYNENDDVNSLVHELAFGIDICFDTVQLERRLLDCVTESLTWSPGLISTARMSGPGATASGTVPRCHDSVTRTVGIAANLKLRP